MSPSQAPLGELRSQDHFLVHENWLLYAFKQGSNRILHSLWTVCFWTIIAFDMIFVVLLLNALTWVLFVFLSGLSRCTHINIRGKLGLRERDDYYHYYSMTASIRFVEDRKLRLERHYFRRKSYRQKRQVEPLPLPPRRKHRLSEINLHSQPSANLLMRLPLELRREIYECVLVSDSRNLHIAHVEATNERTRLFSYACEHPWELHSPKDIRLRGFHHRPGELGPANCFPYAMPPHRLALVKVCRQVYLEAIDIIYSMYRSNRFYPYTNELTQPKAIEPFTSTI